jgi:GNAT superfamily N-acetyltransferase
MVASIQGLSMELGNIGTRLGEAAALMHTAFATNKEAVMDYTPEFLASCYQYPGLDRDLSPAFFEGERMVSVLASFPRRVRMQGRDLRIALLTFNSVDPGFRRYGLGIEMVNLAARLAKRKGYDGAIFYCVDGNMANQTSVAGIKASGAVCRKVFALDYVMAKTGSLEVSANAVAADEATFLDLSGRLAERLPFARLWTRDEVAWELSRYGVVAHALESGGARGLISGYILKSIRGTPCAQIENILWDDLDAEQKSALLRLFLKSVAGKAQVAVMPLWNYVDADVFLQNGFRNFGRRCMNVYLALWNGAAMPGPLDAMYIDVL